MRGSIWKHSENQQRQMEPVDRLQPKATSLLAMMISCFVAKGDPLKHMADRCCCWKCCYSLLTTWGKVFSLGENPIVFLVLLCLSLCWTPIKFDIVEVALFLSGARENHLTPIPLPPAGVTVSENFCKNTILFHYYYHENEQFFSEIIFCSFTEVPKPSTIIMYV